MPLVLNHDTLDQRYHRYCPEPPPVGCTGYQHHEPQPFLPGEDLPETAQPKAVSRPSKVFGAEVETKMGMVVD